MTLDTALERQGAERRKHPRVALGRPAQIVCGGRHYREQAVDISEGGMRLVGFLPLPLSARLTHEPLKVFLDLPSSSGSPTLCFVEGEVVWRSQEGIGIRFVAPPAESLSKLRSFVRHAA